MVSEGVSERKRGLSTEQFPVSAYVGSPKNLKDLRARTGSVDLPKPRIPLPRTYPQKIHAAFRITSGPPVHRIAADSSLNHFTQRGVGTFRTLRLAPIPQFRGTTNPRRWLTFLRSLRIFGLKLKSQKLSEYLGQHSTSYSCSPFYGRACRWAMLGELKPKGPKRGAGKANRKKSKPIPARQFVGVFKSQF